MTVAKLLPTILLGLAALLLVSRTWVRYRGNNQQHTVWIGVGLLRIRLRPRKKAERDKPPKSKKPKKPRKPPAKKEDKPTQENRPKQDWGAVFYAVLDLLDDMHGNLHMQAIKIQVLFGTKDAAATGMLLGTCSAFAGMLAPYLEQNFKNKSCRIVLDADFEASQTVWEAEVEASVRLIGFLWSVLKSRKKLVALKHLLKNEEADV